MTPIKLRLSMVILMIFLCMESRAKLSENKTNGNSSEVRPTPKKIHSGESPAMLFADEFKQTFEKYLFGICPPTFKSRWSQMQLGGKAKNLSFTCDLDTEQQELAGRLATLALRAHSASRLDCTRFGAALANTFGELARTAANRQALNAAAATAATDAKKQRKLSKSQKMKIVAKQRKALAVKNKAAAVAAAAAAKIAANVS